MAKLKWTHGLTMSCNARSDVGLAFSIEDVVVTQRMKAHMKQEPNVLFK
jgi:hypothetical protein